MKLKVEMTVEWEDKSGEYFDTEGAAAELAFALMYLDFKCTAPVQIEDMTVREGDSSKTYCFVRAEK